MKNLLFYFGKQSFAKEYAFVDIDDHKVRTHSLFYSLLSQKGFDVFFVSRENYIGNRVFKNPIKIIDGEVTELSEFVTADIIFDRSNNKNNVPEEFAAIMFNTIPFKKMCSNKWNTYALFGQYMAKSMHVDSLKDLQSLLKAFPVDEYIVVKPSLGIKGNGVVIDKPGNISLGDTVDGKSYLLQEFVDTSRGISGIVDGVHDLRIVIVNSEIIMAMVRVPAQGSLLSNVNQGGNIWEVSLDVIPENIMSIVLDIKKTIASDFGLATYSLDFGVDISGKPFLFEISDRHGFPRDSMPSSGPFIKKLSQAIFDFSKSILAEK